MTLQLCACQGVVASFKKFWQEIRIGNQFAAVFVNSSYRAPYSQHAHEIDGQRPTMPCSRQAWLLRQNAQRGFRKR